MFATDTQPAFASAQRLDAKQVQPHNEPIGLEGTEANSPFFYTVTYRPTNATLTFDHTALSVGTRRVLRILVSMLFDASTVLLLEQPEDAIHSDLLRRLMSLLKSYSDPLQFILASHSADVFNKLTPEEIRLVTMNKGVTSLRPMTPAESDAARKFVAHQGSLADFLETIEEN